MTSRIKVEVVYGLPHKQSLLPLEVELGCTIEQAIIQSGIARLYPEIDVATAKVGIFSRPATLTDQLSDGDRVEIYRPLLADPKEIRKRRAEQAKAMGRADKVTGGRPNNKRG